MKTPLPRIPTSSGQGIPQDNIIFAFIFLAFIIFITVKGELQTYMGFFVPGKGLGPPIGQEPSTGIPGLSVNPFQGLPSSWGDFLQIPHFNYGSPIFGPGGQANPNTGSNMGLGN